MHNELRLLEIHSALDERSDSLSVRVMREGARGAPARRRGVQ